MKKIVLIVMTLLMTTVASAQDESSQVPFQSKEDLIKKFHESGFEQVLEIERGVINLTLHSADKDSSHITHVGYNERVPELDFVLYKALARTIYARAYKAHDSMICYVVEQAFSKPDQSCFIFPYNIDDVIDAVTKQ